MQTRYCDKDTLLEGNPAWWLGKKGHAPSFCFLQATFPSHANKMIVVGISHWMPCQAQPNAGLASTEFSSQHYEDTIF